MADKYLNRKQNFQGSGWAFPVEFSLGNHQLVLSAYEENINDSIYTILTTKNGERNFNPQFGSNLQRFMFRSMDDSLKGEMKNAVKASLLYNEPRITVQNVEVVFTDIQSGGLEVNISYIYNQTNTRHNYVFPFYLKEGTNLRQLK
ncbi:MAG: GPW/gp25 family protein [Bacteroidetes bacterium]|nr:GPW/gp25 family protein [Bacteroidota bacterium]